MMNSAFKRILALLLVALMIMSLFAGCGNKKKTVTIYSSAEDYRNAAARKMLTEKFPELEINLVDTDTGTLAAKMAAEGTQTDADIILEL